jgi:hypothetical protein
MKRTASIFIVILFAFTYLVPAQAPPKSADTPAAEKIKKYEEDHSQVMDILSYLSDVYGPRLNYSPEYKEAADWASGKLQEWGLENIHYDLWDPEGKGWSLKSFYAEVISPRTITLIAYPKAWSPGFDKAQKADVVYLDAESPEDLNKYEGKLKGKFVLISEPAVVTPHFSPDAHRLTDSVLLKFSNAVERPGRRRMRYPRFTMDNFDSVFSFVKRYVPNIDSARIRQYIIEREMGTKKLALCIKEKALAAISVSRGDDGTIFVQQAEVPQKDGSNFGTRINAYDPDAPEIIPQIVVAAEQYNRMVRMIAKGEKLTMEIKLNVAWTKPEKGFNIIGEIPGSDLKDEIVMIGGHFDTWHAGTGATDDGTGSAVCMEAMRIIKALGLQPRRTIRIGLWGAEEEGLVGSREFVAEAFAKPRKDDAMNVIMGGKESDLEKTPEYNKFSVYFNDDNGGGKFRGIYTQGNEAAVPIFRSWLHEFGDPDAQTVSLSNTGGTDHLSFDAAGLPGFQFIQDPLDYSVRTHHSNMDVYERVVEKDIKQSAAMMAFFAYKAAMADAKFPRKGQTKPDNIE